jgi:hypothetical protein
LYAASGALITSGRDEYGHLLAAATSAGMVALIYPRYAVSKVVVPSGVLVGTGIAAGAYDTFKSVQVWRNILEDD